jgi:hypothetical protein
VLRRLFPIENPLGRGWLVAAISLNVYYPPEPGMGLAKVDTLEVTSWGCQGLDKFDAQVQGRLEGYLASLGLLQPGQKLTALDTNAANQQSFSIAQGGG